VKEAAMKASEVRNMKDAEIKVELGKLRTQVFDLNAKLVTATVEDTSQFRKTRKDIARLLTERRRREIAAVSSTAAAQPAAAAPQPKASKKK
jgi:large subunit ribosomal protein L29